MIDVFETGDLGEAHDMLNRTYARMRLTTTGSDHRLRLARLELGPVALHHVTFAMRFTAEIPPTGLLPVCRTRAGSVRYRSGGTTTVNGPGGLLLPAAPDAEIRADSEDHDGEYARFEPGIFARVADAAPNRASRPIRFTGSRPVSGGAAWRWNQTFDYVRDTLAGVSAADEPLIVGTAVQALAAATLAAFPNTALREPGAEDRRDAHPATLRRAIAFIDENADRDITPADIAVAARVTIRSLQMAFRRHLGTTPRARLRRVRLEHAHRQLLETDPSGTTVAAIAMRWGFASHSSFSAHYRDAYGVPPSVTLRRR